MQTLTDLESFMRLLHAVQNTERFARIPEETKRRNTAEHTFELALVCWYISTTNNLNLDIAKILTYALVHDLTEAYAGDAYIFDAHARKNKEKREQKALQKIRENFPEFRELAAAIQAYEMQTDEESQFVYAVDKLIDPINLGMETKNSFFKEHNVSYKQLRDYKDEKIAKHPIAQKYWEQLCKKLESHKTFFFHD